MHCAWLLKWSGLALALRARQSLLKALIKAISEAIARTQNKVMTSLWGEATPAKWLLGAKTINSQFTMLSNYPINPLMQPLGLYNIWRVSTSFPQRWLSLGTWTDSCRVFLLRLSSGSGRLQYVVLLKVSAAAFNSESSLIIKKISL